LVAVLVVLGLYTCVKDNRPITQRAETLRDEAVNLMSIQGENLKQNTSQAISTLQNKTEQAVRNANQKIRERATQSIIQAGQTTVESARTTVQKAVRQTQQAVTEATEQARSTLKEKASQVVTVGKIASTNFKIAMDNPRRQVDDVFSRS